MLIICTIIFFNIFTFALSCNPQGISKFASFRSQRTINSGVGSLSAEALSVNEQNAADSCLTPIKCLPSQRYRSIDGTCNNIFTQPGWGASNTAFVRLFGPSYTDGFSSIRLSHSADWLPSPRIIRLVLFSDRHIPDPKYTLALMQWGQIVAHDVTQLAEKLGPSCCTLHGTLIPVNHLHKSCFPVVLPLNDPFYSRFGQTCLDMKRMHTSNDGGCTLSPVQQVSSTTHFLDASLLYGASDEIATNLRTRFGGRLKTQLNSQHREFLSQHDDPFFTCNLDSEREVCYKSGDSRANQNTEMVVSQVMLLRLHNTLCFVLSQLNPTWHDELLYQEARRVVIAIVQHITYNEYIPIILGDEYVRTSELAVTRSGYATGYDGTVNPSTLNEFAGAAFRSFHSTIQPFINLVNESRSTSGVIELSDWMNKPSIVQQAGNFDGLLRGFATQPQQAQDMHFTEQITNLLFKLKSDFGTDLLSLDINRGRDMGLPTYTSMRKLCGLTEINSFEDLNTVMDAQQIAGLLELYEDVRDIDYLVGGLLEEKITGTLTTPVFHCVLREAFFRYKFGDRFFYEFGGQPGSFTPDQLNIIKRFHLSTLICLTSDNIQFMQRDAFLQISSTNLLVTCSELLSDINFQAWKEQPHV